MDISAAANLAVDKLAVDTWSPWILTLFLVMDISAAATLALIKLTADTLSSIDFPD